MLLLFSFSLFVAFIAPAADASPPLKGLSAPEHAVLPGPSISYSSTAIVEDNGGYSGRYSSSAIVNGKPAIAFQSQSQQALFYVQAADSEGMVWKTPVKIDTGQGVGLYISLEVINGKPAVGYQANKPTGGADLRYAQANDADGATWSAPVVAASSNTGFFGAYASLAEVDGNPAMSYYDGNSSIKDLMYVRAMNSGGTSWNAPVKIGDDGTYSSMTVVNGKPAVAYYDQSAGDLKYAQADSTDGSTWKTPLVLHSAGVVGIYPNLKVVDGQPAIVYKNLSLKELTYIRSIDVDGNGWGTPVVLQSGISTNGTDLYLSMEILNGKPAVVNTSNGLNLHIANDAAGLTWAPGVAATQNTSNIYQHMTLLAVNGKPAVAYSDLRGMVRYVLAQNGTGSSWNAIQTIDGGPAGRNLSINMVNGHPAIVYNANGTGDIKFKRASDTEGETWPMTFATLSTLEDERDTSTSLAIINGNPAVAYFNSIGNLMFTRATDVNGVSWGAEIVADANANWGGGDVTLLEINGRPAIAYHEGNDQNLFYIRATDANGTGWGTPQMLTTSDDAEGDLQMALISGVPAIAFAENNQLKYIQAADVDGAAWKAIVTIDSAARTGRSVSLATINGRPAVSYQNGNTSALHFTRANDADGTTWPNVPQTVGGTNFYTSLTTIDGRPAITFWDQTSQGLGLVHAIDEDGNSWGPTQLLDSDGRVGLYPRMVATGSYSGGIGYFDLDQERLKYHYFRYDKVALTTLSAGNGSGTISKNPDQTVYDINEEVVLSVIADPSSIFNGWSGGCTGLQSCTVTMDTAKTLTATFTLKQYEVTTVITGTGGGTVGRSPDSLKHDHGTMLTLTASADEGSTFTGWSAPACVGDGCGGPTCSGTSITCTLTIDGEKSVTAEFTLNSYPLTLETSGSGAGTISPSPSGSEFDYGTVITLTATAAEGSTFAGWSGGGCSGTGACVVTIENATSVTASFIDDSIGHQLFLPIVQR